MNLPADIVRHDWPGGRDAEPVEPVEIYSLLEMVRQNGLQLLARLWLDGAQRDYRGMIDRLGISGNRIVLRLGPTWLQLQQHHIGGAWIVRTPTRAGLNCSVELFDLAGHPMLTLDAARPIGGREPCEWRLCLSQLLAGGSV